MFLSPATSSSGGSSTAAAAAVLPSVLAMLPPGVPNPFTQEFLRSPTSLPNSSSEASDERAADVATPVASAPVRNATDETLVTQMKQVLSAQMQLVPVRAQFELLETTRVRAENIQVGSTRAELHVIPTRHGVEPGDDVETQRIEVVLNSVRITGLAMSVGAVWWAARATGLVTSLLTSAPAWRHVDPLPVLGRDEEDEANREPAGKEDDEAKDEERRARWVLEDR